MQISDLLGKYGQNTVPVTAQGAGGKDRNTAVDRYAVFLTDRKRI